MSGTNMLMHLNEFNVDTVLQHLTGKLYWYWKTCFRRDPSGRLRTCFCSWTLAPEATRARPRSAGHPTMVFCSDFPGGISGGMRDKILYSIMSIHVANIGVFVYFFISHLFFFICVLINYWSASSVRLPRIPFFPLLFLLDPSWFVSFFNLTLFGAASSKQVRSSITGWLGYSLVKDRTHMAWAMNYGACSPKTMMLCYAMLCCICYILHCYWGWGPMYTFKQPQTADK